MNQKPDSKALLARTSKAKDSLKKKGHNQILPIYSFLYQDSDKQHLTKVQNALQGKITDNIITERIEDMADQVK